MPNGADRGSGGRVFCKPPFRINLFTRFPIFFSVVFGIGQYIFAILRNHDQSRLRILSLKRISSVMQEKQVITFLSCNFVRRDEMIKRFNNEGMQAKASEYVKIHI